MKLLMNEADFSEWVADNQYDMPPDDITKPEKYPCYAYTTVISCEGEKSHYLYEDDITEMMHKIRPRRI